MCKHEYNNMEYTIIFKIDFKKKSKNQKGILERELSQMPFVFNLNRSINNP